MDVEEEEEEVGQKEERGRGRRQEAKEEKRERRGNGLRCGIHQCHCLFGGIENSYIYMIQTCIRFYPGDILLIFMNSLSSNPVPDRQ